jgi:hypothetical protein
MKKNTKKLHYLDLQRDVDVLDIIIEIFDGFIPLKHDNVSVHCCNAANLNKNILQITQIIK